MNGCNGDNEGTVAHSLEQLAQNVVRSIQLTEETQKLVASLAAQREPSSRRVDEGDTTAARQKERTPERVGVTGAEREGRLGSPSLLGDRGWVPTDSATPIWGEWIGDRKLEMPIFTGDNSDGWIFQAECYFAINQLAENEKLTVAGVSLDGDALSWLQWTGVRASFVS